MFVTQALVAMASGYAEVYLRVAGINDNIPVYRPVSFCWCWSPLHIGALQRSDLGWFRFDGSVCREKGTYT